MRAERANFERRNREFQIIDWTGRRCEVKHVVDLLFREEDEVRDVVFDEPEILVPGEMADVRRVTGDQIVDGDDAMTFSPKAGLSRCEPRKPAPPVTTETGSEFLAIEELF